MRTSIRGLLPAVLAGLALIVSTGCPDPSAQPPPDGGIDGTPDGGSPDNDGGIPDGGAVSCAPDELPPLGEGRWDDRFTIAGVTGEDGLAPSVYDFAIDDRGALLAAGRFEYLGPNRVPPIIRLENDAWAPARPDVSPAVQEIGFSAVATGPNGELALATGDVFGERTGEIWLDTGSGLTVIGRYAGNVRRLVWFNGALWVAGTLTLDEAPGAPNLAVWDGAIWNAPPGGPADGPVYELRPEGDHLLIGGSFDNVGGIAARRVAEFDGATWVAHDLNITHAAVYALERDAGGALIAGGVLVEDPDTALGGIARYDGDSWTFLGNGVSNGFFPGVVSDLLLDDGNLYVTGCFKSLSAPETEPQAIRAFSFARWTGSAWESLDDGTKGIISPWYAPFQCGDEGPDAVWDMVYQRVFKFGQHLYLAGAFPGLAGVASHGLIAFDPATEEFIPQGAPQFGVSGIFQDFAVGGPDCAVYGIGLVTHVGTQELPGRVAKFDDGWTPLGAALPEGECMNIEVNPAGDVFIGCTQFPAEGPIEGRVFRLEGDTWAPVGEAFTDALVFDLVHDRDGALWVAGGGATGFVARLDGDAFTIVEDGFDGPVLHLAIKPKSDASAPTELAAAGAFLHIGTKPFTRIARWTGEAWEPLGPGLSSAPSALEYGVHAIYAATQDEGNADRITLGRWNGSTWEELATPEKGLPAPIGESVHTFEHIREVGSSIVAAGSVWPETGGRNAFLFDGEAFSPIGGGVNAIDIQAMAVNRDGLWFGGTIAETGTGADRRPAIGVARFFWE